jgi:adenylate cyclase
MTDGLERWLVDQGLKGAGVIEIMDGFCNHLVAEGFPLVRGYISVRTLHPKYGAVGFLWQREAGGVEAERYSHESSNAAEYLRSPFAYLIDRGGGRLRRRLIDQSSPRDFPVLDDFVAAGITDYIADLLPFGGTERQDGLMSSWATDRPGGFDDAHLERMTDLLPLLAVTVKATATYRVARNLLGVYLGHDAGDRVLAGAVRRGSVETIRAVLFYADLAGFTRVADTTDRDALVATLDDYLEAMAEPVDIRGGQVLKFLGDGLLATFALADFGNNAEAAAAAALDAAEDALARTAVLNLRRQENGQPVMNLDIALHLGDVLYGNVGTDERLDFTVIGPAVNEASRIEALCRTLERRVLISSALAEAAGEERHRLVALGSHPLRGVREPQELYGLAAQIV